jgi:hypothetical protein
MVVAAAGEHSHGVGDLAHGGGRDAFLGEQLRRGVQNDLTPDGPGRHVVFLLISCHIVDRRWRRFPAP